MWTKKEKERMRKRIDALLKETKDYECALISVIAERTLLDSRLDALYANRDPLMKRVRDTIAEAYAKSGVRRG